MNTKTYIFTRSYCHSWKYCFWRSFGQIKFDFTLKKIKYPLCKTFNTVRRNIQNATEDSLIHSPQNAEKRVKTSNFLKMLIIHSFLQISKYNKDFEDVVMQSSQWTCRRATCHFWGCLVYRKNPNNLDTQKSIKIHLVMGPQDADGMVNNVNPDQTAVWSGSTLFAQTCLSENLGTLRYLFHFHSNLNGNSCMQTV